MASANRRQLVLLAVLVAVLIGVLTLRQMGDEPAEPAAQPSNPVTGTAGQPAPPGQQAPVTDVKLELLQAQRREAPDSARNLFRFQPKAPPPPPPGSGIPQRGVPAGPPVPQGPPPPPPIPLKFIGLLNAPTQAGRIAMLTDGRGNTIQAREGDIIEGRYRLLKLGADSAELAYLDGRGRQVIRLSGQ